MASERAVAAALTALHAVECAANAQAAAEALREAERALGSVAEAAPAGTGGGDAATTAEGGAVHVDADVLDAVDKGFSPDAYACEAVRAAVRIEQQSNGQAAWLRAFRDALLAEASAVFPEETRAYRRVVDGA